MNNAKKFSTPARNPDLNPIENVFNYERTNLHEESLNKNITFENFKEYSASVKKTFLSVPVEYINKTIESMDCFVYYLQLFFSLLSFYDSHL